MRMTEKNVLKALKDYNELVDKTIAVTEELGYDPIQNKNEMQIMVVTFEEEESKVVVYNSNTNMNYATFPISYLLDKEGTHVDEYKKEKEEVQKIENRVNKFKNSFSKKL